MREEESAVERVMLGVVTLRVRGPREYGCDFGAGCKAENAVCRALSACALEGARVGWSRRSRVDGWTLRAFRVRS